MDLYNVVTLKEAADWFDKQRKTILLSCFGWERKHPGQQAIRMSGGTYLVSLTVLIEIYGAPKTGRPDYE